MKVPPLSRLAKVNYSLGSTAEAIAFTTTSSFLLIFYNQVRGLPASHVGIALAAGLIVNAIFDPMVGSWSDRTRSRWGRRHPFMFAAILPAAACFFAVFNPPSGMGEVATLAWLAVMNTALLQAMTLYHTPHLALGSEMSDDYLERSSIMGVNTFCLWIGDTLGWLLSFRVFFAASKQFPNGALDPSRWPLFSIVVASTILILLAWSSWSTTSRIPYLPKPDPAAPKFGVVEFFRDVRRALSNRNYVVLLFGLLFNSLMIGVRGGLWLYSATYFWQLNNNQISFFVIGSFSGYLFAAFAVKWLHARFDKRWTGMFALLLYCIGPAIPLALGWAGVLTSSTPGLLWILIAFSVLQHAPYSIMTTTIYSALADIADENELKFGMRQEGVLYSTRTFFARVDQALGTALAGWVLTLIAFPAKAVPGAVDPQVLSGLAAAFVLSTIPGLIATVFYGKLQVTRKTHDATRAAIDAQQRQAPAKALPA